MDHESRTRAIELMFCCRRRLPLLTSDRWNRMLARTVNRALGQHGFELTAFVFMPERVHLLVVQRKWSASIARMLCTLKRTFAREIRRELEASDRCLLQQLTVREGPGKYAYRFWETGPGHVCDLTSPALLSEVIDAIHATPVAAGLCELPGDWKWSSWRHQHLPATAPDPDLPHVRTLAAERCEPAVNGCEPVVNGCEPAAEGQLVKAEA
jgi:putative transposase